jgi:hypothetical protein
LSSTATNQTPQKENVDEFTFHEDSLLH